MVLGKMFAILFFLYWSHCTLGMESADPNYKDIELTERTGFGCVKPWQKAEWKKMSKELWSRLNSEPACKSRRKKIIQYGNGSRTILLGIHPNSNIYATTCSTAEQKAGIEIYKKLTPKESELIGSFQLPELPADFYSNQQISAFIKSLFGKATSSGNLKIYDMRWVANELWVVHEYNDMICYISVPFMSHFKAI